MKYYFSSCMRALPLLEEYNHRNLLMSFAVDAKRCGEVLNQNVIIDSGAFSVWNKGITIDIDEYLNFCLKQPKEWTYINLDVIPPKGSSSKEIEKCVQEGYENYQYLKKRLKNVMPVYHLGESTKWLEKYMQETDYVGVGFGNSRHEKARRAFLKEVFNFTQLDYKVHGLGYSSLSGLSIFPFYSVDSISFKKTHNLNGGGVDYWNEDRRLWYYLRLKVKQFIKLEKEITELWESRGIKW